MIDVVCVSVSLDMLEHVQNYSYQEIRYEITDSPINHVQGPLSSFLLFPAFFQELTF